ncbi:hypothetical protein [Propionibacterium sp.]|uniref:hypothetical protein n=1 Tax=Propionibacterium sp. TaxID=1977903 RepID=UPI0039EADEC0
MPIRSITAADLSFQVRDPSPVVDIRDRIGSRLIGSLTVAIPAPWQPTHSAYLDDEFEWGWSHPSGASCTARLSAASPGAPGSAATLRLVVTASAGAALESSPPQLHWHGSAPVRCWLGGSRALAVLDERPEDGVVTVLALTSGVGRPHSDASAETPDGLVIDAGASPTVLDTGQSWICTWALRRSSNLPAAMARTPEWLPRSVAPAAGEAVRFELPDVVVVSNADQCVDEHGTELSSEGGRHDIALRGPGLDCTLTLVWNAGRRALLAGRATQVLESTDPRKATPAQAAILDRAMAEQLLPHDPAQAFLDSFCEEFLAHRHGRADDGTIEASAQNVSLDPLVLPVLVDWAANSAETLTAVAGLLPQLEPGPGAMLGWLAVSLASRTAGLTVDAPIPVDADDVLYLALHDILVRRPEPTGAVWQSTYWLHGPLPADFPAPQPLRTAMACAVLSFCPARWCMEQRLGIGVHEEIENTRAWLATGRLSDEELAWLMWS